MSTVLEDRLGAALEARAELVTTGDLRPLEVPDTPARGRRRTAILLCAAAAAVVVGASFALARVMDGSGSPRPTVRPTQTAPGPSEPTATTEAPRHLREDAIIVAQQHADLDGDGQPDHVWVIVGSRPFDEEGGTVEVTLATGATDAAPLPPSYTPKLLPALDINGDGHEQLMLSATAGGDEAQLLVYTWFDDGLVRAHADGTAPLALGLDGQGTYADYYRDDDRGLVSWLRGDPVDPGGWPMFTVDQWSWAVDGDRLVATPIGQACVDATAQRPPSPCA
jgi:hypothetical protein